ncbi:sodium:solute symporter [Endozoicomonas sp. SCSIO W0465]|uniref:sodium:solute symporter family protein n=1 Tax=Endozoicomonas sp. SCSIO W0465 TaxID=2918516 RepID=UPI002074B053|nr:sodium:solute symporter family protein [Endozoicomonas sp. SCSIO W0465]USE39199.1 sodium:solute symporter family protein [Endozoicomonas sp. SCSIO W0465]
MTTIVTLLLLPPFLFLLIGLYQLRSIHSFSSFALDRNAFGTLAIYCTILASGVGAGMIMGNAEKAYQGEWVYPLGSLGFSLQLWLTARLAPRIYQWRHCLSFGEILGRVYDGNDIRSISGTLWLIFCLGIVTAQVIAMQRVVNMLVPGWELPVALCLITSVILYSSLGGVRSVVTTDIIQAILLLFALVALIVWGIWFLGGIESTYQQLQLKYVDSPVSGKTPALLVIFLGFLLGDALIPISVQRVTMARSHREASKALQLTAGVVLVITLFCGLIGVIANLLEPGQQSHQTFNILLSSQPFWLKLLTVAGLLAAVMSSCDSYLNTAAIAFSNDILPAFRSHLTDRQRLILGRIATLVIGAGAILIALNVNDILDVLLSTFESWGPTLLPPLFVALFYSRLPKRNFYLPCISGIVCLFLWKWLAPESIGASGGLLAGTAGNVFCTILLLWRTRIKKAVVISWHPHP